MRGTSSMSNELSNLAKYFALADTVDLDEGMVAYERYNMVMRRLAEKYSYDLDRVCAVFCSLSPNSDYWGNLRSTVSVLQGLNEQRCPEHIVVSTYGHCKLRAIEYARGTKSFIVETRGPKIMNFYHNILSPHSSRWVTIDGHMVGVLRDDRRATMRELLIKPSQYHVYADIVKQFAFSNFMLPCQMQAILWFVRKRLLNIVYEGHTADLFGDATDMWKTARDVETIKPYSMREERKVSPDHRPTLPQSLPLEGGECREVRESKKGRRSSASTGRV
jgi:hypothetical protein